MGKTELIVVFLAVLVLFVGINSFENAEAIKSKGNSLTETTSKLVCGNFMCDEPMSIAEKIAAYLLSLAQQEEPETNILQQFYGGQGSQGMGLPGSEMGVQIGGGGPPGGPRMTMPEAGAKYFESPDLKMKAPKIAAKSFKSFKSFDAARDVKASNLAGRLIEQYDLKQDRVSIAVAKVTEGSKSGQLDRDKFTQMRIAQKELERLDVRMETIKPQLPSTERDFVIAKVAPGSILTQPQTQTECDTASLTDEIPPDYRPTISISSSYLLYGESYTVTVIDCYEHINPDPFNFENQVRVKVYVHQSWSEDLNLEQTGVNSGIYETTYTPSFYVNPNDTVGVKRIQLQYHNDYGEPWRAEVRISAFMDQASVEFLEGYNCDNFYHPFYNPDIVVGWYENGVCLELTECPAGMKRYEAQGGVQDSCVYDPTLPDYDPVEHDIPVSLEILPHTPMCSDGSYDSLILCTGNSLRVKIIDPSGNRNAYEAYEKVRFEITDSNGNGLGPLSGFADATETGSGIPISKNRFNSPLFYSQFLAIGESWIGDVTVCYTPFSSQNFPWGYQYPHNSDTLCESITVIPDS